MKTVQEIAEIIKSSKKIVICQHVAPDGDCLGSMLAMKGLLEQIDSIERVDAVITGKIPSLFAFLTGVDTIKNISDPSLYQSYDLAIAVDCATKDRMGEAVKLFNSAKTTINLDHHMSNQGFADIDLVEPKLSATGEIVHSLIEPLGVELTRPIAENLYAAIITDTGGFKFQNTRAETLQICAELIQAGADPVFIYKQCFEYKPVEAVKLLAKAVNEAVFLENNTVVYTKITRELINSFNAMDEHVDGITEELRHINTVKVAVVFKENLKGNTKVSFRSNSIDVCEIATFYGGGGHKQAAGCLLEKTIDESVETVIATVLQQLSRQE